MAITSLVKGEKSAEKIVPHLEEMLKTEQADGLRTLLVAAGIGQLRKDDPKTIDRMAELLRKGTPSEQRGVLNFLESLKKIPTKFVPALISLLEHPESEFSLGAIKLLGQMGKDAAPASKPLAEILAKKGDALFSWVGAFEALQKIGPAATEAVPILRPAITEKADLHPYQTLMAFAILKELGVQAKARPASLKFEPP